MHAGRIHLHSVDGFPPAHEFNKWSRRYRGNASYTRILRASISSFCMAFATTDVPRESRDIETCLARPWGELYHAGFRGRIARSTLADAQRTSRLATLRDFAHVLIAVAKRPLRQRWLCRGLGRDRLSFDSTTIDLCLSLFPGTFSPTQGRSEVAHAHRPAWQHSLFLSEFSDGKCTM